MFAWAVEEELLPVTVHQSLMRVKGLRKGKAKAREKARIKSVTDAHVDAVLPLVPRMVRAMIEVHRLCGGRPQDILEMRATDIDLSNLQRKTSEPIAYLAKRPRKPVQHVVGAGAWDDDAVQAELRRHVAATGATTTP